MTFSHQKYTFDNCNYTCQNSKYETSLKEVIKREDLQSSYNTL